MVLPVTGVPTLSAPATHCSPDLGEAPSEKAAPLPISPLLIVMGWTVSPQREMLRSLLQEQKMWPHSEIGSWQTQLRWDRSDRSWFSKPGVSITKGKYGYKPKGEMPCEDEGGGQGDAAEAVEHQRWSADYLKLGGEAWNGFSFTAHKRGPPCWHLDLGLPASMTVKVKIAQSCPTLCDPMDYTVRGILQARILEGGAFPFSRGSSQPRDWTQVSHIMGGFFTSWAAGEALQLWDNTFLLGKPPSLWLVVVAQSCPTLCNPMHTGLPCPSPSCGACPNSCLSSPWCHPTISSSVAPFSSCLINRLIHTSVYV